MSNCKRLLLALFAILGLLIVPARSQADVANWQKGMTMAGWWVGDFSKPETITSLNQLATKKVNWIAFIPHWYMQYKNSTSIYPETNAGTVGDAELVSIVQQAHARGIKVMIKPHVDPRDGTWRGNIAPSDTNAWFQSYRNFIVHYAQIAAQSGAEQFSVGCELLSLTGPAYTSYWRSIIADIRSVYKGQLTYAANYGTLTNGEYAKIQWWDAVDYIGVDAYFGLSNAATPTVDQIKAGWYSYTDSWGTAHRWVDEMKSISTKWGKKILFTEIGFSSRSYAGMEPYAAPGGGVDMTAQNNCVEGTLQVFDQEPWMGGAFWWTWSVNPTFGGTSDGGMYLNNKPAADTIGSWYGRSASADTTPPATPSGVTAQAAGTSSITVQWNASTDNVGVAGYRVYRSGTLVGTVNATSYTDNGLTQATAYSYQVSAVDAAGNESGKSTAVSATTASPADTQAPSVPTGLTAAPVSTSQITLRWGPSTDNVGVAGYNVYRNGMKVSAVTSTTYTDTGLSAGTSYSYQVAAYDSTGNTSALSASVPGTTTSTAVPTGYDFETGTQGWTRVGTVTSVATSTAVKYQGTSALVATLQKTSSSAAGQVQVQPPSTLVAGATVTMQVYLAASNTNVAAAGFIQDAGWAWSQGTIVTLKPYAWTTVTITIPAAAKTPLTNLGAVLFTTSGNFSGKVYVDNVSWGAAGTIPDQGGSTPNPTPDPTAQYDFENGSQGWSVVGTATGLATDSTVKYSGNNSLAVSLQNTASGAAGQVQVQPPSTLTAGTTVTMQVYLAASNTNVAAAGFVQDSGWAWSQGTTVILKPWGWTQISVTVPAGATAPLNRLGLVFFTNSGSFTGKVFVDTVGWGGTSGSTDPAPAPAPTPAAKYDFEGSTQGWSVAGTATGIAPDTSVKYSGSSSLAVALQNTSSSAAAQVQVQPPTTLVGGTTVTMQVYLASGATNVAAAGFFQDSGWRWAQGTIVALKPWSWTTVTVTLPAGTAIPVNRLGALFFTSSGSYTGKVYIDAVNW